MKLLQVEFIILKKTAQSLTFSAVESIRLGALLIVALLLFHASSSWSATVMPSVTVGCTNCTTYQQLLDKARITAPTLGSGGTTPPGYPAGNIAVPGKTLILVSATAAPLSYAFTYTATPNILTHFLTFLYNVAPLTTLADASDAGALKVDMLLYKALRRSGLPVIQLPSNDANGNPLTGRPEVDEALTTYVTARMPVVGIPGLLQSLPGIFNWARFPTLTVVFDGTTYILYDEDEVTIQFFDGSQITLIVTVGGFGGSPGIFRVKQGSIKAPPSPPSNALPGISLNTLVPNSSSFTGDRLYSFEGGYTYYRGNVTSGDLLPTPIGP